MRLSTPLSLAILLTPSGVFAYTCQDALTAFLASGGEEGISGQRSKDSQELWAKRLQELYGPT